MELNIEGTTGVNRENLECQNLIVDCELGQMVYLDNDLETTNKFYVTTDAGEEIGYVEVSDETTLALINSGALYDGVITQISGDYGNINYQIDWVINQ